MRHLTRVAAVLGLAAGVIAFVGSAIAPRPVDPARTEMTVRPAAGSADRERVADAYARLSLAFTENRGQTDGRVRYHAIGARYGFFLTPGELRLSFVKGAPPAERGEPMARAVDLALRFLRGDPDVALVGEELLPGTANYLLGDEPSRWFAGLRTYAGVLHRWTSPRFSVLRADQEALLEAFLSTVEFQQ